MDVLSTSNDVNILIIVGVCVGVAIVVLIGVLAGLLTRRPRKPLIHQNLYTNILQSSLGHDRHVDNYRPISLSNCNILGLPKFRSGGANEKHIVLCIQKYHPSNASSSQDWYPQGSAFELVGGAINIGSSVAVRSRTQGGNSTNVYVTGNGGNIYQKWHGNDQVWSGWDGNSGPHWWGPLAHNGVAFSAPAIVSYDELVDNIFVLGQGAHNSTIHSLRWASDVGGSYIDLGGAEMQFTPASISWDGTRVDIFGVSLANNHLFHTYTGDDTTWAMFNEGASFENLGGFCTTSPTITSTGKGLLDVFVRGGDGGLWQLSYNGSWSPWTLISGNTTIQGQPDALSWNANRIDIFAWGPDNSLLTKSFNTQTNQWTPSDGFDQIDTGLAGLPKSLSDAMGSMHVFAYSLYDSLVWKHWNISEGGTCLKGEHGRQESLTCLGH